MSFLCITTTKPSLVLTPGSGGTTGGGSITLASPLTGSIGASLRCCSDMAGRIPIGATSLSFFPPNFNNNSNRNHQSNNKNSYSSSTSLALAYGYTSKSKDDAYAMLLSIPSSAVLPPILHWKSRLPEGNLTAGLSISPCGHYIVGGGHSGTLYVWTSIGGQLIRTTKAHYRSIQVLTWTSCGHFLATGGADGMVHVFTLMDLVAYSNNDNNNDTMSTSTTEAGGGGGGAGVFPFRTWSNHQLPVHDIVSLTGGRLATGGQDGLILILEISSEDILATIQLPHGIQSLTTTTTNGGWGSTLYAGSVEGTIYIINLDQYAIYQLTQQGAVAIARRTTTTGTSKQEVTQSSSSNEVSTMADQVFGHNNNNSSSSWSTTKSKINNNNNEYSSLQSRDIYRTELKGHERSVTSLCILCIPLQTPVVVAGRGGGDGGGGGSVVAGNDDEQTNSLLLCSGDESGLIRLWDLESRTCIRVLKPWSHGGVIQEQRSSKDKSSSSTVITSNDHPISSIRLVAVSSSKDHQNSTLSNLGSTTTTLGTQIGGLFGNDASNTKHTSRSKNSLTTAIVHLVSPLQTFVASSHNRRMVQVPFLSPTFHSSSCSSLFWDVASDSVRDQLVADRLRAQSPSPSSNGNRNNNNKKRPPPVDNHIDATNDTAELNGESSAGLKQQQDQEICMNDNPTIPSSNDNDNHHGWKAPATTVSSSPSLTNDNNNNTTSEKDDKARIVELEQQLAQANHTIQRWQTVNNKLLEQIQQQQQQQRPGQQGGSI